MKTYVLIGKSGSQVVPNGKQYHILNAIKGQSAIISNVHSDEVYRTSPIKEIITVEDSVTLVTKNTHYYFEEVSE